MSEDKKVIAINSNVYYAPIIQAVDPDERSLIHTPRLLHRSYSFISLFCHSRGDNFIGIRNSELNNCEYSAYV